MSTFIFLRCVPVPGWQQKIDFVTKAVLDKKKYLYSSTTPPPPKKKLPSQRMPLGVFGVKKVAILGGGGLLYFTYTCQLNPPPPSKIFGDFTDRSICHRFLPLYEKANFCNFKWKTFVRICTLQFCLSIHFFQFCQDIYIVSMKMT